MCLGEEERGQEDVTQTGGFVDLIGRYSRLERNFIRRLPEIDNNVS